MLILLLLSATGKMRSELRATDTHLRTRRASCTSCRRALRPSRWRHAGHVTGHVTEVVWIAFAAGVCDLPPRRRQVDGEFAAARSRRVSGTSSSSSSSSTTPRWCSSDLSRDPDRHPLRRMSTIIALWRRDDRISQQQAFGRKYARKLSACIPPRMLTMFYSSD